MTPQQHQSTSKKRLLSAHQKPKQAPNPRPGPPIIPPDDQLLLPPKKTRDLPNLSDCHGCNLHINHTNPKDRLQTLDSVWRIVLLCKKCIKRVELGQTCPYCFKESANAECFKCRDCERLIHKDCVVKHDHSSPWSLCESELGLGFTVCVDCWVPKVFRKSIRIRRRKKSWKGSKKLSFNDSKGPKNGGRTLIDANCLVGREIVLALRAQRKRGLTKAEVRRKAKEFANGAVNIVANKAEDGKKKKIEGLDRRAKDGKKKKIEGLDRSNSSSGTKCGENTSVSKAVGDAELAFQLHRAMNSSSRNLKNLGSLNTSCIDVFSKSRDEIGFGSLKPGLITYRRRKWKKELKTYKRGCLKRKRYVENSDVGSSAGVVGNNSGGNSKIDSDSCCNQQGEMKHDDGAIAFLAKCDGGDAKHRGRGICDEKTDYYLLKYSKRPKGCKSRLTHEIGIVHDTCQKENQGSATQVSATEVHMNCSIELRTLSDSSQKFAGDDTKQSGICDEKTDRYLLKYSKRLKGCKPRSSYETGISRDTCQNENQGSATEVPMDCSIESRTLSDSSLNSYVVDLQANACVRVHQEKSPEFNR